MIPFLQDLTPLGEKLACQDSLQAGVQSIKETIASSTPQELLSSLGHEAIQFGLKVLAALAIYIIGGWVVRRIKKLLKRGFERKGTDATIATFTISVVTIGLWVIIIILTVGSLGVNTSSLAALLAAGGMAIGMALGGTVQNFAGGIMILAFKPFKAGDFIEALGYMGTVQGVTMVATKLLTTDNRVVVLPNGALSGGNICNYSGKPLRRVDRTVSVSYGIDAEKAKAAIMDVMKSNPKILDATTEGAADPFVAVIDLAQSSVNYVVRAWVRAEDYWDVFFFLNETIYTELPKKGVTFPFPQLDVHIQQS